MIALLRVIRAYFLRGWHTMLSYRFALWLRYVSMAFQVLLFFFIWQVFRGFGTSSPHLSQWGGNWFAYAITGGLAMSVLGTAMGAMVGDVRSGQVMGTLETILASPMQVRLMLGGAWCYSFTRTFISLAITLAICTWVLEFDPALMRFDIMVVAFLAIVVAFTPLGILSTAFTLAFKRGDPVALITGAAFTLFGGVVFPPSVLPGWLQPVSQWLPITYATNLARESILGVPASAVAAAPAAIAERVPTTWAGVSTEILILFGFGLILFPISVWGFTWGLNKARRDGSLSHY